MIGGAVGNSDRGGWYRLPALAIATLFVLSGIAAVVVAHQRSVACDFLSFWAAGRLTLEGNASWAYDIARHHLVEAEAVSSVGLLPFPYPPFMLAFFVPFGMLPFWIAFAVFVALTASLYLVSTHRLIEPRFALAQASAAANFITGQNGFLGSSIFIGGARLLERRPFIGGALLGLLIFKPQLALLLPVALIAGREWRAIGGGIASSLALVALSLLLFGSGSWSSFLALLPHFSDWLSAGRWPWGELASSFALLRWFGVPKDPALLIHCAIALAAAAVTWRSWALRLEHRVPVLAAASLLVPPYLFTYDALLLTLPLAALSRLENRKSVFVALWLLALLPGIAYLTPFPNTIPLAALLSLWALHSKPHQV